MSRNIRRLPHGTTKIFTEIWDNAEDFVDEYTDSGLYLSEMSDSLTTLYYLLYAKYGNSSIANLDENQFKYKCWSIIFQYGPTWRKRLSIQTNLRGLTESDITAGSKAINAHAYGMGDAVVAADTDPTKIDAKTSTVYSKPKLEGYATLIDLLETDVTEQFLSRFKSLFATFVYTKPDVFITELVEDEEDD